jgi:hypothetical protein
LVKVRKQSTTKDLERSGIDGRYYHKRIEPKKGIMHRLKMYILIKTLMNNENTIADMKGNF